MSRLASLSTPRGAAPLVLHEQADGGVVFRVLQFRSGERLDEADEIGDGISPCPTRS